MEPIKIVLVDSEEIFLEGLSKVLQRRFQTGAVLSGNSLTKILEEAPEVKPRVVVLGKDKSGANIYDCIKNAQELLPEASIAVILPPETEEDTVEILKTGVLACLSRCVEADDFLACMQLVLTGRVIVSNQFAQQFLNNLSRKKEDIRVKSILSEREIEVAKLVAQGNTNREIAQILFVTENTVKVHVRNILGKLKFKNRQQLVAFAVLKKWLPLEQNIVHGEAEQHQQVIQSFA